MRYGIANSSGQVRPEESAEILRVAREAGIDSLDTAVAYGVSEQTLGGIGIAAWRVITKIPPLPNGVTDVNAWLANVVAQSLERLRIPSVHGLLLHRPADLLESQGVGLARGLVRMLESGVAARIGVSIYSPAELEPLMARLPIGIIQSPFSVFDRRLETSGWLARLSSAGVEIHTRSAFMQGLLVMPPVARPAWTRRWESAFSAWDRWLESEGISKAQAALTFALSRPEIARIVVGIDRLSQLEQLIGFAMQPAREPPDELALDDIDLLDPSRWPKT
jgi:aryl-alcohol dehydrogenase-like predicted oxidoreductase